MKIYLLSLKKVKKYLFPLISAFACALIIYTMQNPSVLAIKSLTDHQIFYRGNLEDYHITLTFNITEDAGNISPLLTMLKKKKIQNATFFISNDFAKKSPKMVEKIADMGYDIGLLGDKKQNYKEMNRVEIAKHFEALRKNIEKCGIEEIHWLRLPNGTYTHDVLDIAKQFNFTIIHWSINVEPNKKNNIYTLQTELKHGDLLVYEPIVPNIQLISDLSKVLPLLKEKGYTFVSITDLITNLQFQRKEIK